MSRIPDDEIERLKRETKLEDLVGARGIELKKHGENLLGLCPFHDDREPSLVVTPAKNLWNCLGACGGGGDVIEWVMKSRNVGFRGAVEILWEREGSGPATKTKTKGAKLPPLPLEGKSDAETLRVVADYYHERLSHPASPGGLEYLERRGVRSDEAIERFRIGFGDRTLGLRVPGKEYKAGREIRDRLQAIGLLRASTGREHFNGCLVFPITNPTGEVVEVYGRKIADDQRHRHGKHLYLPGPHRGIWNGEVIGATDELIICESILDALSFWVHGFRDVIAAFGVNGFTDEMFAAVASAGIERILIAYDRDDAGDRAATKLGEKLATEGIGSFRVLFPRGMDANDTIRTMTPARKSLELLLRSAEWMAGPKERSALGKQRPVLADPDVVAPVIAVGGEEARDSRLEAREELDRAPIAPEPPPELFPLAAASEDGEEAAKEEKPADEIPTGLESLAPASLASSPEPPAPAPSDYSCIEITLGERNYRIRGLEKCATYAQLKVLVRVARGEQLFVDQLDFIQARQRAQFIKHAAEDLGVKEEIVKNDLAVVYRELERLQDEMIRRLLEPKETTPVMSETDVRDAMTLLQEKDLITLIVDDLDRCGLVGERTNKLMTYLAAVSRKLDDPLAILIQSSSAAGKTTVMDAILRMMPDEEQERYSAVTGKALFYISEETSLRHKILAISEEEGAEQAAYALKLLQSEGKLSIASTGKDSAVGQARDAGVSRGGAGDDPSDDDRDRDRRGASQSLHRADG
ncbi:MAG: toprim domain-containing protein [Acidobacteria bacterium]|nr:toprim domain-containing protein [Acidobacteriota bacterium]